MPSPLADNYSTLQFQQRLHLPTSIGTYEPSLPKIQKKTVQFQGILMKPSTRFPNTARNTAGTGAGEYHVWTIRTELDRLCIVTRVNPYPVERGGNITMGVINIQLKPTRPRYTSTTSQADSVKERIKQQLTRPTRQNQAGNGGRFPSLSVNMRLWLRSILLAEILCEDATMNCVNETRQTLIKITGA